MKLIQKYTPNQSERQGYKPEIVVIHIAEGSLVSVDDWFSQSKSKVSAHYCVGEQEIHQYVAEDKKAWSNGIVNNPTFELYKPNVNPNLYTISIECEGNDLAKAPETQLQNLCDLIKDICTRWDIPIDRKHIIAHYEIDGVRKTNCPTPDRTFLDKLVQRIIPKENLKETIKAEIIRLLEQL